MKRYVDPEEQLVVELFTRNLERSLALYRRLGFEVLRSEPDFAEVAWEGHRLFLDEQKSWPDPPSRPQANIRIMVPDVDRYWALVQELDLRVLAPIKDRSYGLRDFTILDLDGFGLRFATRLDMEVTRVKSEAELQECIAVRKEVFVVEQGVPEEHEIDEWDALEAAQHLLLRYAGRSVACGRVRRYDDRTAKLQRIAVRQERRGQGFGRHVIAGLEGWAREAGYEVAILDAQTQAEGFYQRLGYQTISPEPFLDEGIPHVRMQKRL